MIIEILTALSAGFLGIFLGAQIAEAILFVPYWKSLPPIDFFELHKTFGKKIYQFFAPLTILATFIPLLSVLYSFYSDIPNKLSIVLMGLFTFLFFSTYFLYFKEANQKFADESISHDDLPRELNKWENWHWTRIIFELIAFIASIIALLQF